MDRSDHARMALSGRHWRDDGASQMLIILAYQRASPSQIAPFNYTVVIFSGLIGWIVWHNTPGMLALRAFCWSLRRRTQHRIQRPEFTRPLRLGRAIGIT